MKLNEVTVPGTWKKKGKDHWEMDAGRGWLLSVYKKGSKYHWEVTGRKHSSSGTESSFKDAQTIGVKQYRQVREERIVEMYTNPMQQGDEPDTKERFQTVGSARLDDYKLIAKINRRNKMRALNLLNGRGIGLGESTELFEASSQTSKTIKTLRDTDYRDQVAFFKMVQLLKGLVAASKEDELAKKFLSEVSDALTMAGKKVLK